MGPSPPEMTRTTLTLLACALMNTLAAQWSTDLEANTLAGTGASTIIAALSASDGSTLIPYWRVVPPPTNMELRLQKLDADGVPQFGSDGLLVSPDLNMSTFTVLATAEISADDHLYIGVTSTNDEVGHVFKLDADGNHLWDPAGISFAGGYGIAIEPLSNGEALVAWLNVPNALMQKYDPAGGPVWPGPVPIVSGGSKTAPEAMFERSDAGYTVIFHTYNFGISSTLWAQGYDSEGNETWSAPVQLSNKTTVWNTTYSSDAVGDVVYIGYMAATGLRFDSFLQRINPDGTLPWGINGSDFDTNETDYEMNTRIALAEEAGVAYAICNYKDPSQVDNGERIQRFDLSSGERQLTDHGQVIFPIGSNNLHASDLHLADGQPLFLMESGYDNGFSSTTLHAVLLGADGSFAWPEEFRPVGLFDGSKSRTHLSAPVAGQTVAVWQEDKGTGPCVYAQNLVDAALASIGESAANAWASVFVYPNPARQALHFAFDSPPRGATELEVSNLQGQVTARLDLPNGCPTGSYTLDVADWPKGIYLYRIHSAPTTPVRGRFIID